MQEISAALRRWFAERIPGAREVWLRSDLTQLQLGHSNETFILDVGWRDDHGQQREEFVLRLPPEGDHGLLAPYDVGKQFHIMRCLRDTSVPVPDMYWYEESDTVLGRPFFAMAKVDGTAFERSVPLPYSGFGPEDRRAMARRAVETMAHVANVDWKGAGIDFLGEGSPLGELERWSAYFQRHRTGPMPAFELVLDWLHSTPPPSSGRLGLLHGDIKWGNFLWTASGEVQVLVDWEMAGIGDPLTDLAYYLVTTFLGGETAYPLTGGLSRSETIELFSELTGITVPDLAWHEALVAFKLAAISHRMHQMLALGETDDLRCVAQAGAVRLFLGIALRAFGGDPTTDPGIVEIPGARLSDVVGKALTESVIPDLTDPHAREQAAMILRAVNLMGSRIPETTTDRSIGLKGDLT